MPEQVPDNASPVRVVGDSFVTSGTWFGPAERPLAGWWTTPNRPSRDGVVIAPPLGYEYWSTHRSLRTLAETLARTGWHVLRFDWDGTGDSAGEATDPDRVAAWRGSLTHAVSAMRDAGVERVVLVGLRLGATLALLDAAALGVDEVVACAPVISGKRFVKELKLLGIADPEQPGNVMFSGLVVNPNTAAELARIDLDKQSVQGTQRALVVSRNKTDSAKLVANLRFTDSEVAVHECPQMHSMLDEPTGDATVPENFIEPIITWLGAAGIPKSSTPIPVRSQAVLRWRDGAVRESFRQIDGLAAVCCEPVDQAGDTAVVFLNSGAEPHIGPARAWVEYARSLALHEYHCLRTDFSGWGESPDEGHARGRPYDSHCIRQTLRIAAALRASHKRVVLVGLCAGAWAALNAAQQIRIDGVFALNPQLYWQPGDPVETLMIDTHRRRTPNREREAHGARLKYWSLLDLLGIRPMASRWLITLRKNQTPVLLSFAEGDDGLTFLRNRCGHRLAHELRSGYLVIEEVQGIDHPMYRMWRRPAIIEQMLRFLDSLPAATTAELR